MADKKKQNKGSKKGSKTRAGEVAGASVAAHPRAGSHVHAAKAWGGLIGFLLAAYLSYGAGLSIAGVGFRALIGGVAGYLLTWALAVNVWRHLLLAELRIRDERVARDAGSD